MDAYLDDLQFSTLALPEWAVFLLWVALYTGSNLLRIKSRSILSSQTHILLAEQELTQPFSTRLVLMQIIFAVIIFAVSHWGGSFGLALLAGGLVVAVAVSFAFNLQSLLFISALSKAGAAEGTLTFTARLATRDKAFQMFTGAAICFCIGLLIAHLSLLGGAVLLASSGFGYLRRANAPAP
jgi:hypothetical protein